MIYNKDLLRQSGLLWWVNVLWACEQVWNFYPRCTCSDKQAWFTDCHIVTPNATRITYVCNRWLHCDVFMLTTAPKCPKRMSNIIVRLIPVYSLKLNLRNRIADYLYRCDQSQKLFFGYYQHWLKIFHQLASEWLQYFFFKFPKSAQQPLITRLMALHATVSNKIWVYFTHSK